MDDIDKLRRDVEHLRADVKADRTHAGFGRVFAALAVAVLLLPWLPVYAPLELTDNDGNTTTLEYAAPVALSGSSSTFVPAMVLALVGLLLALAFTPRQSKPVLAVSLAAMALVGLAVLVSRAGVRDFPELSGSGTALTVTLIAIVVMCGVHMIALNFRDSASSVGRLRDKRADGMG